MKRNPITAVLIFLSITAWCQERNTFTFIVAPTHTSLATAGTYEVTQYNTYPFAIQSGTLIGVTYDRRLVAGLSVEGGIFFVREQARYEYSSGIDNHYVTNGHINMQMVQCLVKYTVFKHFFADMGIGIDAQNNRDQAVLMPDQSGFGLEVGFGAKVNAGHFVFSVNPFWRAHAIIAIFKPSWNHELDENGVKFGVGYNF